MLPRLQFNCIASSLKGHDETAVYQFYLEALEGLGWRRGVDIDTLPVSCMHACTYIYN